MKSSLTIIKIVLTVASIVSIGTALGATVYFGILKNNPPVATQPTPSITQILTPTAIATLTSIPTVTPILSPDSDIITWQEYNSNLTTTYLFKSLKAPFSFKYPKDWNLDEGLSGIQIYSSDDHIGYEIGTVPAGKFMVQIAPDIEDKNNEEIKSWCKNNLYNSTIREILSEKYIEVDGNKSYMVDYKIGLDNFDSLRQICIAKPGLKVIIFGEPLDSNYLGIFDKILSTFKFMEIDNTVDWKTYRNEKYGFEFKYPGDWSYKETIPQPSNYGLRVFLKDSKDKIELTYDQPIPEVGYEAWTLVKTEKKGLFTKRLFQPKPEYKDYGNLIFAEWYGNKFENSGQFGFNYEEENDPRIKILDQILSTFKFIEKGDTSDWKTYRNSKFKFEFDYPSILTLEEKKDSKVAWDNVSVFIKSNDLNGYILVDSAGVGTGFDIPVSSENIIVGGLNSKLEIMDSSADNERAAKVSFEKDNNEYYWLFKYDKNDASKLPLIKSIFSTFKFL